MPSHHARPPESVVIASGLPPLHGPPPRSTLLAERGQADGGKRPTSSVYLSSSGTFVDGQTRIDSKSQLRSGNLAIAIRQRIESRIGSRIRNLAVRVSGNTIVLEGRCATYYSKQLAQHAALGVIEDENLENDIVVAAPE